MIVHVINRKREVLTPISPVQAKLLLMDGKARVVKQIPYTIQLLVEPETSKASPDNSVE